MLKKPPILAIAAIISSLLICEVFLMFFFQQKTYSSFYSGKSDCYLPDPILYAVHKTNTSCEFVTQEYDIRASLNNLGFRSKADTQVVKNKGTIRILFLGDSFIFGQGASDKETIPFLTGKYLESSLSSPIETINAGIVGSEVTYEYLYLTVHAKKLNSDIIVATVFLGNDLADLDYFLWSGIDQNGLPTKIVTKLEYVDSDGTRKMSNTPKRYKVPLLRESHLFLFLAQMLFGKVEPFRTMTFNGTPCLLMPSCKELDPQIKKMQKVIEGMKTLADKNGQKLLIVIIPWELQFPRDITQRSQVNFFAARTNRHYMGDRLGAFLKNNSIEYIDLLDTFENYRGRRQIFYPQDRHWTPEGNKVAARAVAEKIASSFMKAKQHAASEKE